MARRRPSWGVLIAAVVTLITVGTGCIGSVTDEEFERILDERRGATTTSAPGGDPEGATGGDAASDTSGDRGRDDP